MWGSVANSVFVTLSNGDRVGVRVGMRVGVRVGMRVGVGIGTGVGVRVGIGGLTECAGAIRTKGGLAEDQHGPHLPFWQG
jgi:hypothetical protein